MKELEEKAKQDLLRIYKKYLASNDNELVKQEAKEIYNEYVAAKTLLSEKILNHVGKLFPIAYPDSNSGLRLPNIEEVEKIIKELEEL